jgi:hypothetical protein
MSDRRGFSSTLSPPENRGTISIAYKLTAVELTNNAMLEDVTNTQRDAR